MSGKTVTLTSREQTWSSSRKGMYDFLAARREEGERKYGKGRKNAAYHRDNLLDVLEELSDAAHILDYFFTRYGAIADAGNVYDVERANDAVGINNRIFELIDDVDKLRESIDDNYPKLLVETVKRLVRLAPQPTERE